MDGYRTLYEREKQYDESLTGVERRSYFEKYCSDCKNNFGATACAYCRATELAPTAYTENRRKSKYE